MSEMTNSMKAKEYEDALRKRVTCVEALDSHDHRTAGRPSQYDDHVELFCGKIIKCLFITDDGVFLLTEDNFLLALGVEVDEEDNVAQLFDLFISPAILNSVGVVSEEEVKELNRLTNLEAQDYYREHAESDIRRFKKDYPHEFQKVANES